MAQNTFARNTCMPNISFHFLHDTLPLFLVLRKKQQNWKLFNKYINNRTRDIYFGHTRNTLSFELISTGQIYDNDRCLIVGLSRDLFDCFLYSSSNRLRYEFTCFPRKIAAVYTHIPLSCGLTAICVPRSISLFNWSQSAISSINNKQLWNSNSFILFIDRLAHLLRSGI